MGREHEQVPQAPEGLGQVGDFLGGAALVREVGDEEHTGFLRILQNFRIFGIVPITQIVAPEPAGDLGFSVGF